MVSFFVDNVHDPDWNACLRVGSRVGGDGGYWFTIWTGNKELVMAILFSLLS